MATPRPDIRARSPNTTPKSFKRGLKAIGISHTASDDVAAALFRLNSSAAYDAVAQLGLDVPQKAEQPRPRASPVRKPSRAKPTSAQRSDAHFSLSDSEKLAAAAATSPSPPPLAPPPPPPPGHLPVWDRSPEGKQRRRAQQRRAGDAAAGAAFYRDANDRAGHTGAFLAHHESQEGRHTGRHYYGVPVGGEDVIYAADGSFVSFRDADLDEVRGRRGPGAVDWAADELGPHARQSPPQARQRASRTPSATGRAVLRGSSAAPSPQTGRHRRRLAKAPPKNAFARGKALASEAVQRAVRAEPHVPLRDLLVDPGEGPATASHYRVGATIPPDYHCGPALADRIVALGGSGLAPSTNSHLHISDRYAGVGRAEPPPNPYQASENVGRRFANTDMYEPAWPKHDERAPAIEADPNQFSTNAHWRLSDHEGASEPPPPPLTQRRHLASENSAALLRGQPPPVRSKSSARRDDYDYAPPKLSHKALARRKEHVQVFSETTKPTARVCRKKPGGPEQRAARANSKGKLGAAARQRNSEGGWWPPAQRSESVAAVTVAPPPPPPPAYPHRAGGRAS